MDKDMTFADEKPRWGIIANLAITLCVILWAINAKLPIDYSSGNYVIRCISPWIVAGSTITAALCNYLWTKNMSLVWLLNLSNFLFWLLCPALISRDSWEMFMINDAGWWYCLFAWAMMSTTNALLFKRPDYSVAKNKAILGTMANLLLIVFCAYLSYTCYKDMKYQESFGWELKEDWCLAYHEMKIISFLILPCVVSCICNYFIAHSKNLVWILNASNTVFWCVLIYDIYKSNSTYSSMPVIMILVLIWGAMFTLNHCLLGSIFKRGSKEGDETNGASLSDTVPDNNY